MLYEIKNNIIKKSKIKWVSRGRKGEMEIHKLFNNKSVNNISVHKKFTNLFELTGYRSNSECSFVKLK